MNINICITGHRPNSLYGYDIYNKQYDKIRDRFNSVIDWIIKKYNKIDFMYDGLAMGIDQIFFEEVYFNKRDIKVIGCIPFKNQPNMWHEEQKEVYKQMLEACYSTIYVDTLDKYNIGVEEDIYHPAKMQKRNEYMVDNSDIVISCWNGKKKGGTWNCIKYAMKCDNIKEIYNINPITFEIEKLK